jgi:uracil-DNA glycosylase
MILPQNPEPTCTQCPRLADFRNKARIRFPHGYNAPVMNFGAPDAALLIVGLAPGLQGANLSGRPFTGDWAGDLLYETLLKFGFAQGHYLARPDDGLALIDTQITNAVRCVPPDNKPLPVEISQCRPYLSAALHENSQLRAIVALGRVAHESVLRALGEKLSAYSFAHGAEHRIGKLFLFDSYHCSRYNTNTGVLTPEMFCNVFKAVRLYLEAPPDPL